MTDLSNMNISSLSVTPLYHPKSRSSTCWKYFGNLTIREDNKKRILNSDKLYCSECLERIKISSVGDVFTGSLVLKSYSGKVSSGNFTRHLLSAHGIKAEPKVKQIKTEDNFGRKLRNAIGKSTTESTNAMKQDTGVTSWILAKNVAIWCCKSLIPFDYISDEGMMDFFKKYNIIVNDEDLPLRQTVSNAALTDIYENVSNNLKKKIDADAPQRVALAFNMWNDQYRQLNYITFTLHYLTYEFKLMALTLTTQIMNGKKTKEGVERMLKCVTKKFGLDGKIHAVIEPGKNVERVALLDNIDHHVCLGHALHNLITIDGIKGVSELDMLVTKCKNIVKTIRYRIAQLEIEADMDFLNSFDKVVEVLEHEDNDPLSECDLKPQLEEEMMQATSGNLLNYPSVKLATPTRWYLILEMLEVLINNRDLLNNMLILVEELRLSDNEWTVLDDLLQFLRKIRDAVIIVSSKSCTINLALVFRSEIIDILNSNVGDESLIMMRLKCTMLANINLRFPVSKTAVLAALLDYRFMGLKKVDLYLESQNMSRASFLFACVKEIVISNIKEEKICDGIFDVASTSHDGSFLQKLSQKHSVNICPDVQADRIEQECRRYISSFDPSEPKDCDLLEFWNRKKDTFPHLASVARAVLCLPATTAPGDMIFSAAGLIKTAKKSRLSPMMMNKIIFVHDNYEICSGNTKSEEKPAIQWIEAYSASGIKIE